MNVSGPIKRSLLGTLVLGVLVLAASRAGADYPFVVENFRVQGAQRIQEGTIYNYLPINIGDTVDVQTGREAMEALYDTGFFRDIELRQDGNTLVIAVLERPWIEEFTFSGNEDIEDEQLRQSLEDIGLQRGRTLDRSVLEEVTQLLTDQYYSQGKYAAQITPVVEELPDNRVRVEIQIEEGQRARIRQINIVGNTVFSDDEILDTFELTTGNMLSFIRNDDRYSREALEGDLESLRSYYMDRGYADFRVDDAQVQISPDKQDIFVTISITEGDLYQISDVRLAGEMVVPEQQLRRLVLPQPGQIFSQQLLATTEQAISDRLGMDGYSQAEVRAVPELNEETQQVEVTFFIDPQNRVYVRRINFSGVEGINDEVLRREMRQLEGGYLSNPLLERSRVRLQRLPYIESAEYETVPVPGSPDLVDVDVAVEQGLSSQLGGTLGYSESQGLILGGNVVFSNFMGTGNRVQVDLSGGEYYKTYQVNHTDPYRTIDGLQRTLSLQYRDITQFTSVASDFSTETLSLGATWSYPITELQEFQFGLSYRDAELLTGQFSSTQARDWVRDNGEPFDVPGAPSAAGTNVQSYELTLGWSYDSLNNYLFPTRGTRLRTQVQSALPGSEVEYYVANLDFTKFFNLPGRFLFRVNSNLAYGGAYGETTSPPPFRNFFGGGPDSVRGFEESYLGPRDSRNNPYGGNLRVENQFELILPTPQQFSGSTRIALFYDVGNIFSTTDTVFRDKLGDPIDHSFEYDRLKSSVGLAVEWLAPLGLLRFSYASPLNADEETDRYFGDRVEEFQFSIGQAF